MRINPEGRAIDGLTTLLAFIALNVIYLVSCLPVVTIGAATSALYEVTIRYSDEESGHPVKDFFPAFARNFRAATPLALVLLLAIAGLAFSGVFWIAFPNPWAAGIGALALLAAAYFFCAFLHAMALVARFRSSFGRTLKNALLLPAAEPLRTLFIVLIPVTIVAVSVMFPPFLVVVATLGFSVGAYGSAFLFRSIFARHLPAES